MIPTFFVELMAKDRARSVSPVDEHGRPKDDEFEPVNPAPVYPGRDDYPPIGRRASIGYKDSSLRLDRKYEK
ncbi:MAG: hypothetical protein AABX11_05660 [Nanoarchaeota archaeon]